MQAILFLLLATLITQTANAPYYGRWKYNSAKSDPGSYEMTVLDMGGGELQQSFDDGRSYRFRLDAKQYDDGAHRTASWQQLNATTWESKTFVKGELAFSGRFELAPAGNEMKMVNTYPRPGGPEVTVTWHRVGAGSGLIGKWSSRGEIPAIEFVMEPAGETES